jgi:hypothetical protein
VSGGSAAAGSAVVTVRAGTHPGYDRFVVEFSGTIPSYSVARQSSAAFTLSPSGQQAGLDGDHGLLITLKPTSDWTAYSGPTALRPAYPYLRQARMVQNFEAVQQWGLGIAGSPCIHVFTLASPSRLVVDVTAQ